MNDILLNFNTPSNDIDGIGIINGINISNCNARYLLVNSDADDFPEPYPLPENVWNNKYIMQDDFSHNASAGNLEALKKSITALLIKRKKINDPNSGWITIAEVPIEDTSESVDISASDYTAVNDEEYAYAIVSYFQDANVVREGSIDEDAEALARVNSLFDGVFICSPTESQRLYANVQYDNLSQVNPVGVHETLGSRFPIVVSNASINYNGGGVSGTVLNKEYIEDEDIKLDRGKLTQARENFAAFISNKEPKIIKDWNKNIWLTYAVDNPDYTFYNSWGMGLCDLHFAWVEIGKPDNTKDLQSAGFITRVNRGD